MMVFQELDKWMLDIEEKASPTAKERRLHLKLERIKDETRKIYMIHFEKNRDRYQVPSPSFCRERAMHPFMKKTFHVGETSKKAFGGDI
jgi:hypothetical protein